MNVPSLAARRQCARLSRFNTTDEEFVCRKYTALRFLRDPRPSSTSCLQSPVVSYIAATRGCFVLSLETLMTTYVHANKTPTKASMSHVQQEPRRFARNAASCRFVARLDAVKRWRRGATLTPRPPQPNDRARVRARARWPLIHSRARTSRPLIRPESRVAFSTRLRPPP